MTTKLSGKAVWLPWVMCGLGALYYCYEYFLRITPSVMIPELMSAFNLTGAETGSLSAFYYHAYVPMQIIVGLMMDKYGPRRLLTLACASCVIGTFMFAGSGHSLWIAEAGRFLVGFGSAFAFVGALKLATLWLPPNRFALVSGIIMCLGMIGAMAGDIMLRALVDAIGWHTTLYGSGVVGIVLALVLWVVVRDSNPFITHVHHTPLDFRGLIAGLLGAVKNPQIWLNGLVGLLLYVSLSAFAEVWGIAYLEQARHLSRSAAANANSMIFLGWAIGAPFWGWLSDFLRRRCRPISVASVFALILVSIFLYAPNLSETAIFFLSFFFGFLSSVQILVFAICHEVSHIRFAATAIALTNFIVMLSGNVFQPLIGKLLDVRWTGTMLDGARVYDVSSYQLALSVMPVSIILAIIIMFFIRETYGTVQVGHHPDK